MNKKTTKTAPVIELRNVGKFYWPIDSRVHIFENFSLAVNTGEFVAIMGPSGSGKSTLLGLISGLIKPDSWEILIGGRLLAEMTPDEMTRFRGQNIAYVFQSFELVPMLTVRENIELPGDINPSVPAQFKSVDEILERVGLKGKSDRYINELSWGEKQRVAIARAFMGKVPFLFADEPTGNLDRKNADIIMDLITELHAETWNTILMITHDPVVAKRAQRIIQIGG